MVSRGTPASNQLLVSFRHGRGSNWSDRLRETPGGWFRFLTTLLF